MYGDQINAVKQVFPESMFFNPLFQIGVRGRNTRMSTLWGLLSPRGSNVWSCSTLNSLTWLPISRSPIRQGILYLCQPIQIALRGLPRHLWKPFLMTEHFAFEESLGYTTQIYLDKTVFFSRRVLFLCIASAISSLPVPLSPVISTEALVRATRFTTSRTSFRLCCFR